MKNKIKRKEKENIIVYSNLLLKIYEKEPSELIPLQANDIETINKEMDSLDIRTKTILSLHWGLDGEKKLSLEKIADQFEVTRERIRQIEARSFRVLRCITRLSKKIWFFSDLVKKVYLLEESIDENIELVNNLNITLNKLIAIIGMENLLNDSEKEFDEDSIFNKSVGEFPFSVRVLKCFRDANIEKIGELVKKTKKDLLVIPKLGYGSLNLINKVLMEEDLYLGMTEL